ncbi:MAG: hypothetical protein FWG81_06575, partial [Betaproteobacteria bacterium]|nr:hypothetical protein [Betaproteobacteria bacterium]
HLDWDGMFALFEQTYEQSHARGIADMMDFFKHPALADFGEEVVHRTQNMMIDRLTQLSTEELKAIAAETRLRFHGTQGGSGDDILVGTEENDMMRGGAGNDILIGGEGNDKICGESGDDIIIGGKGNDYLDGGAGDDTYVFSKGDGSDTIADSSGMNTIRFTDVNVDEITFSRSGTELVITYGDGDQIFLVYHFHTLYPDYRIAQIEFADGGVYSLSELLESKPVHLPDVNNSLVFGADNDVICGSSGNDTILGGAGNDLIYGGEGNDKICGESGDDIIIGGKGNDYLDGGAGDDTYVFSKGDGSDTIADSSGMNTIRFTDVNVDEITFSRSGTELVITYGDGDQIFLVYHFHTLYPNYRIAQIEFADGSVYQLDDLLAPIPFVTGVVYQLSDFIPHEPEPVIDDEEDDSLDDGEEDDTLYSNSEDDGEDDVFSSVAGDGGEGEFSDGIISFTGLNLDEPGAAGDGETFQTAGETLDGLMEPYSGFVEEDYLPDDGEWVDVTLVGIQLPEEAHFGL